MLINIQTPVNLNINHLTDLRKLKAFMDDNNLKPNKSELARRLGVDRRTVGKYLDGFEKSPTFLLVGHILDFGLFRPCLQRFAIGFPLPFGLRFVLQPYPPFSLVSGFCS